MVGTSLPYAVCRMSSVRPSVRPSVSWNSRGHDDDDEAARCADRVAAIFVGGRDVVSCGPVGWPWRTPLIDMSRPETTAPPELFYNEPEARKYDSSSRMIKIQEEITTRAMEMLGLPNRPCYILDIGCGSGLSGQVLEEAGHYWVGCDISS
eukprot:gene9973-12805_t